MSSDEYFTADEEGWEEAFHLTEYAFCIWSSEDGTQWFLPRTMVDHLLTHGDSSAEAEAQLRAQSTPQPPGSAGRHRAQGVDFFGYTHAGHPTAAALCTQKIGVSGHMSRPSTPADGDDTRPWRLGFEVGKDSARRTPTKRHDSEDDDDSEEDTWIPEEELGRQAAALRAEIARHNAEIAAVKTELAAIQAELATKDAEVEAANAQMEIAKARLAVKVPRFVE